MAVKGRIVSRPLPVHLHSCPTPTFISRWLRRMKEGTVWECDDCRQTWSLILRCYGGDCSWKWENSDDVARQLNRPTSPGASHNPPVLDPDDPGPIRTSPDDALERKYEAAQKALGIIGATRGVEANWVKVVDAVDEFQRTLQAIGTLRTSKRRMP